jgi:hypothetical protein
VHPQAHLLQFLERAVPDAIVSECREEESATGELCQLYGGVGSATCGLFPRFFCMDDVTRRRKVIDP